MVDLHLKQLVTVFDLYNDQSLFCKTLAKGTGSASPYADCIVKIKVKIEVDGVEVFCHPNPLSLEDVPDSECATYDLEKYEVPAVIRKILKKTKTQEIV